MLQSRSIDTKSKTVVLMNILLITISKLGGNVQGVKSTVFQLTAEVTESVVLVESLH